MEKGRDCDMVGECKKKLSEIAVLKIKNINLSLQILHMQINQLVEERDRILLLEFKRLKCQPDKWRLDERTWELIKQE